MSLRLYCFTSMPELIRPIVPPGTVIQKVKQLEEYKGDFIPTNVPSSAPLAELNPSLDKIERIKTEVYELV